MRYKGSTVQGAAHDVIHGLVQINELPSGVRDEVAAHVKRFQMEEEAKKKLKEKPKPRKRGVKNG